MDKRLIDELLYEDESTTLDFKQRQYPFVKASNEQKSELLKDILAFANAWRRSDAFILIGVKEITGGKSQVCGIEDHLDEASLQQFVNQKANRPIEFSYQAIEYDDKQIGVIQIPLQERPFYLLHKYGKLDKEKVYIRRGSSTAIAMPDEIAKMGISMVKSNSAPILELHFADPDLHIVLGEITKLHSKLLLLPDDEEIPVISANGLNQLVNQLYTNPHYYREFAHYLFSIELFRPICFVIENIGEALAKNPVVKFKQPKIEKMFIMDIADYPQPPNYSRMQIPNLNYRSAFGQGPTTTVYDRNDHWEVVVEFGDVQPKDQVWSEVFYIGVGIEQNLKFDLSIFADNLPAPIDASLELSATMEKVNVTAEEIVSKAVEHQKS